MTDNASGLQPGTELGKYRLEGLLGRGGMGEVWAAHDPDLDRRVALKVLRPVAAATEEARARLLREGRAMARLRHPNVITVYEATSAAGRDLIAMELIDGKSLAGWLAERRGLGEIVPIVIAAGRGLAAAHAKGMVHRDFKPHNVLVDHDGRVVVTDFGLARAIGGAEDIAPSAERSSPPPAAPVNVANAETIAATPADPGVTATAARPERVTSTRRDADSDRGALHSTLTRTGALLGTPAYMAPEQLDGRAADARSDQFAFCVTAWEAITGDRPFAGTTLAELHAAVEAGRPTGGDRVPGRLRPILARGLATDPAARWPSMDDLLRALDRAWRRPRRLAIAGGIAAAVACAAAIPIVMAVRGGGGASGPCPSFAEEYAVVDAAITPALTAKVKAMGKAGTRGIALLDRRRSQWRDTYATICRRSHDPEFSARRACLESVRDRTAAILGVGTTLSSDVLTYADDPVLVFQDPSACIDHAAAIAPPQPADPAVRAEVRRLTAAGVELASGPSVMSDEIRAKVDRLVEDARRTGYGPAIATALAARGDTLMEFDRPAACAAFDESAAVAEKAGADLERIHALFGMIECTRRRDQVDALISRTRGLIDRLGDPAQGAILDTLRAWILGNRGDWDEAITTAAAALDTWHQLDAPVFAAKASRALARFLRLRHRDGDLPRAEKALRDALDAVPVSNAPMQLDLRTELGDLLWTIGRLDEAVTLLQLDPQPAPTTGARITVHVVEADGTPGANAEIVAAVDPLGDALRLIMPERRSIARARADATGTATLTVPAGAVILARHHDDIAAAAAPDHDGEIRLALRASVNIVGHVELAAGAPAEPTLGRRQIPVASATIAIGDRRWTTSAAVDPHGRFVLPNLLPGTYAVDVEVESAAGEVQAALGRAVAARGTTTLELGVGAPVALRVITHPALDGGLIVAVPGAHPVKTWAQASALLQGAAQVSMAQARPASAIASADVRIGDARNLIAAPGAGPITVCALPGASSPEGAPLQILVAGPAATPPVCVTVTAVDGVVTPVVVPTER